MIAKIHLLCLQKIQLAIPCSKFHRQKLWFWLHFWQKSHEALTHRWLLCFHTIGPQNHYFPFPLQYKHLHTQPCMAHLNYEKWPIDKVQIRSENSNESELWQKNLFSMPSKFYMTLDKFYNKSSSEWGLYILVVPRSYCTSKLWLKVNCRTESEWWSSFVSTTVFYNWLYYLMANQYPVLL